MRLKDKIISLIPVILIVLFFYILFIVVTDFYQNNAIQNNLIWISPIFLAITFSLLIITFLWSFKDLKNLFKKIDRKTWLALIIVFILGLSLRAFVSPQTHRLYFDEDIYLNIGQNIVREGKAVLCNYGTPENCFEGIYNKQPDGYPFLIGMTYLFSNSETAAFHFTTIISSLSILTAFFVSYLLFENKKLSLFSALIFSLIPVAIRWASTTSTGTVFIFFSGLTFLGFLAYFKSNKNSILLFSMVSLAYTIQIRTEGFLLIILVLLLFLFFKKDFFKTIRKKDFLIILIVFSILITPHMFHLYSVKGETWGARENKLGLEYVDKNLEDNGMFFFENTRFPIVFTFLALLGLAFKKYWKKKIFLGTWFLLFFILYLLFYVGSFNIGVDVRFSLSLYLPISILGGCGAYLIAKTISRFTKKNWISLGIVTLLIIASFLPFIGFVSSVGQEGWSARMSHDFLVKEMEDLDDNCWIFTYVPSMVLANGKNALQPWYAQNQTVVNKIFEKTDCVFFYQGYWCQSDPYKSNIKYFHEKFNLTVYATKSKKNKVFTLYHMTK